MHGKKAAVGCGLWVVGIAALFAQRPAHPAAHNLQPATEFSGSSALAYTRRAVSFGQRPPGSAAIKKLQAYIVGELKLNHCEMSEDTFTAQTPVGQIVMKNLIARLPGASGRAIAVTGHYDTKAIPGVNFVGANDGGSSTGFLLELARVLSRRTRKDDVYIVFFDGEEAFGEWSDTNGVYGSRHLAAKWAADGTLHRLRALINVDMIGDKDLDIVQDWNSSASLRDLVWRAAGALGLGRYFLTSGSAMEDDHMPFVRQGVNAVDLIDFNYGPDNAYWHTAQDTMDKLSADSLQVVGAVVLGALERLGAIG